MSAGGLPLVFDEYGRPFILLRVSLAAGAPPPAPLAIAAAGALAVLPGTGAVNWDRRWGGRPCCLPRQRRPRPPAAHPPPAAALPSLTALQEQEKKSRVKGIEAVKSNIQASSAGDRCRPLPHTLSPAGRRCRCCSLAGAPAAGAAHAPQPTSCRAPVTTLCRRQRRCRASCAPAWGPRAWTRCFRGRTATSS